MARQGERQKIYSQDSAVRSVESGTQFTDRISVNGTGATGTVVLTINNVQVEDEVEFICLVKSLTEGTGEGRTNLKVFGKTSPHMVVSSILQADIWLQHCFHYSRDTQLPYHRGCANRNLSPPRQPIKGERAFVGDKVLLGLNNSHDHPPHSADWDMWGQKWLPKAADHLV